jgi:hypothetical protein
VLWTWTAFVMTGRAIRPRALLVTGALTQGGLLAYGIAAWIWIPRSVAVNQERFGVFGVSLTLISWFVGAAFVVVLAATLGVVIAETDHPVARLLVGDALLVEGASPPLPAPDESVVSLWRAPTATADP